jgi:hypothetical protein
MTKQRQCGVVVGGVLGYLAKPRHCAKNIICCFPPPVFRTAIVARPRTCAKKRLYTSCPTPKRQPSSGRAQAWPRAPGCSHKDRIAPGWLGSCDVTGLCAPPTGASMTACLTLCHTARRGLSAGSAGETPVTPGDGWWAGQSCSLPVCTDPGRPVESTCRPTGLPPGSPSGDANGTSPQAAVSQAYQIGTGPRGGEALGKRLKLVGPVRL